MKTLEKCQQLEERVRDLADILPDFGDQKKVMNRILTQIVDLRVSIEDDKYLK